MGIEHEAIIVHPAADLPAGTVVATRTDVYLRTNRISDYPWIAMGESGSGMYVNQVSDEEIEALTEDGVTVLRYGYGEDR